MHALNVLADATTYGPTDFGGDLGGAAATIMPWVGVAVAAGLAIGLTFLGIRKGLGFFKKTAK